MIDFTAPPEIGTILKLDDQDYELREVRPHVRLDGSATSLLVWDTTCPACGVGFEQLTGLRAKGVNRRCLACHKTGKPVKGKRGRKVRVVVIEP